MSGISIYDTQILVQAYNALPRETSFCLQTYRPVLAMILDSVWKVIWLLVFSLRETTPCNLNNYLPGWWGALNLSLSENKWCKGGAWIITGIKQHFERSLFGQHCNISELHHPLLHSDAAVSGQGHVHPSAAAGPAMMAIADCRHINPCLLQKRRFMKLLTSFNPIFISKYG